MSSPVGKPASDRITDCVRLNLRNCRKYLDKTLTL